MSKYSKVLFSEPQLQFEPGCDLLLEALSKSYAIIEFSIDGTILNANDNFLSLMGYQWEEIRGKHHRIFVRSEEKHSADYSEFWNGLREGQVLTAQFCRQTKDKQEVWLQASYCPVIDKSGTVLKVIKLASDITERRRRDADSESQLRAIDRAFSVIEFDLDGNVLIANDNFLELVGYSLDEIVGKHHSIFLHPEEVAQPEYKAFWELLRSGEYVLNRCRRMRKNGDFVWLQASYNPILDMQGRAIKIVKYATDITINKRKEDDLQALTDEATRVMWGISNGDMTQIMKGKYKPELMVLVESINQTIYQLDNILSKILLSSATMNEVAAQINDIFSSARHSANGTAEETQIVASTASNISSNVDEVVCFLDQLSTSIDDVSANVKKATTVSENAAMTADQASQNVNQLAVSSTDIGVVISVISKIANQTNLLALNATIEAVRAGEAGRGFAIVANEVKELAKATAKATDEVERKISVIQNGSQVAVKAIADIVETIGSINITQSSIKKAVESQIQVSKGIAASVREVSADSVRIGASIKQAATIAEENQLRASNSLEVATNLVKVSEELGTLVSNIKTRVS